MQQPIPNGAINAYYSFTVPAKITVESENGLVSTMDFSPGMMLNVEFYEKENPEWRNQAEGSLTFRGNIVVRARRSDEIKEDEGRKGHEIMSHAPYELNLSNALIVVEKA